MPTCGLEPGRPSHASNCVRMCGIGKGGGGCSSALDGNGDAEGKCRNCGVGRSDIVTIGKVEVKAKRPRSSSAQRRQYLSARISFASLHSLISNHR